MNSKKIIAFFLFLPILMASGCVMPSGLGPPFDSNTPVGTGVVIQAFGGDLQENVYYSGEEVGFSVKVKNTGSVKAENGFAELLGLDYSWKQPAGSDLSNLGELFPEEEYCRYTNKKITLLPEDPQAGITGGEAVCTWKYIAPDVLPGLSINVKPRVRFYYSYKSSTIKTITLVSRDELKTLQDQGKGLPSESYSKTSSPISLDIETASPIRTYGNSVEFPIVVTVKNIGGGTPCFADSGNCKKPGGTGENEQWSKIDLNIILPDGLTPAPGSCRINGKMITEQVVFIGSNPQTISCKIIGETGTQVGINQKNIEATANYGYFIDKTTEIIVYPSTKPNSPASSNK
jgi:hypothetical protein